MEDSFARAIGQWRDFQTLAGTVGATLLGLLFVAVSIRPALYGSETHRDLRSIGLKCLGEFLLVVMIGLLFLAPNPQPQAFGITLLIMGGVALVNSTPNLMTTPEVMRRNWGRFFLLTRVVLPTVGYLLLLAVAISLFNGDTAWISIVAVVQMLFLFTATHNAWDLLTRTAQQ